MTGQGELPLGAPEAPALPRGELVEVRFDADSAAYHVHAVGVGRCQGWRCTFPRALRGPALVGQRYLVERLTQVQARTRGGAGAPFYRASGRIWRVEAGRAVEEVTPTRKART